MYFVLILALPLAGAVIAFLTGRFPIAALGVGLATCVAEIVALLLGQPPAEPSIWAGIGLASNPFVQLMALILSGITGVALVMAWEHKRVSEFVSPALGALSAALAVLYIRNVFAAIFLLAAASFLIVFALLGGATEEDEGAARPISAALRYIILMTLASVMLTAGFVIAERFTLDPAQTGLLEAAAVVLAVGFALRIGVAPFHLWVPSLAQDGFLPVFTIVTAVLTPATVVFVLLTMQTIPQLSTAGQVLSGSAGIAFGAVAILAFVLSFAQKDLRRATAYLISGQAGFVLAGFTHFSVGGTAASLLSVVQYAVLVCLIGFSVSSVVRLTGTTEYDRLGGLLHAAPFASAGFVVAALGLVGIPPFGGFAGKVLLFHAASTAGTSMLIWFAGAGVLGLVACARAFGGAFLGAAGNGHIDGREAWTSIVMICALIATLVFIDLQPQPLLDIIHSTIEELSLGTTPA